jgi:mRNA-degrading endonuclease toxin of MazEF toxin-antitoxin module
MTALAVLCKWCAATNIATRDTQVVVRMSYMKSHAVVAVARDRAAAAIVLVVATIVSVCHGCIKGTYGHSIAISLHRGLDTLAVIT